MREEERPLFRARSAAGFSKDGHLSRNSELRDFFSQCGNANLGKHADSHEVAKLKVKLRESQFENKVASQIIEKLETQLERKEEQKEFYRQKYHQLVADAANNALETQRLQRMVIREPSAPIQRNEEQNRLRREIQLEKQKRRALAEKIQRQVIRYQCQYLRFAEDQRNILIKTIRNFF